ncbi:MAG: chorismate synthase [Myxococcales bacterium]|nr:chorismate synthase [Myxococcales bacterium]
MAGNTHGTLFRVTTFGESHGPALGCVVDGCPAGLVLDAADIQRDLDRRRPGATALGTTRKESDQVEVLSGLFDGRTLGTPLCLLVRNQDAVSRQYVPMRGLYRPSHADFTTDMKYGHRDWRGGGRSSARETVGRVAAGAVARKLLQVYGVEVIAWVDSVGQVDCTTVDPLSVTAAEVDRFEVRCPDEIAAAAMEKTIVAARKERDTVGGTITCVARGVPAGLGQPVFDKLEAALAAAMLSLPACKGFESGSGFRGATQYGSVHNDPFAVDKRGKVITTKNDSGGIQGGISNGMPIVIRAAFKPVATHFLPQTTVTVAPHTPVEFQATGRHDPCVLPRAVPIVEAMMCLVLIDHLLRSMVDKVDQPRYPSPHD